MGSLRKTFHTVIFPCYNNSQVLIFLMPWLLKSSEFWCLEAEEGNHQSIQQAPASHLGCRSTSEHLGDWKSCSVWAQANLNVALIINLQSPRPRPTLLVLWRCFCFSNTSPSIRDPHYGVTMTGRELRYQITPESLMIKYIVCSHFLVLHVFCAAQLHKGQNPNKLWPVFPR